VALVAVLFVDGTWPLMVAAVVLVDGAWLGLAVDVSVGGSPFGWQCAWLGRDNLLFGGLGGRKWQRKCLATLVPLDQSNGSAGGNGGAWRR